MTQRTIYGTVGRYYVYVSTAKEVPGNTSGNAFYYPWTGGIGSSPGQFVYADNLIFESGTLSAGGMGSAQFTMTRSTRKVEREEGGFENQFDPEIVAEQWVIVTNQTATGSSLPLDTIMWWGRIKTVTMKIFEGSLEKIGTVDAVEIGHVLDQIKCNKWVDEDDRLLQNPPTFNFDAGGSVIGNFIQNPNDTSPGGYGVAGKFASKRLNWTQAVNNPIEGGNQRFCWPSDIANPSKIPAVATKAWTRIRVVRYILDTLTQAHDSYSVRVLPNIDFGIPPSFPAAKVTNHAAAILSLQSGVPESWDLRGLTIKGALDLMISRTKGVSYHFTMSSTSGINLTLYTTSIDDIVSGSSVIIPKNEGTSLSLVGLPVIDYNQISVDNGDKFDAVRVKGNRIVCTGTVQGRGWGDTLCTIEEGWDVPVDATTLKPTAESIGRALSPTEQAFFVAGSGEQVKRPSETEIEQYEKTNAAYRSQPYFADVFTKFTLATDTKGRFLRNLYPGKETGDISGGQANYFRALCPKFTWDAETRVLTVASDLNPNAEGRSQDGNHSTPNPVFANILPIIPVEAGRRLKDDGTWDTTVVRPVRNSVGTSFVSPLFYEYFPSSDVWINRLRPFGPTGAPQVTVVDGEASLKIQSGDPEWFARTRWNSAKGLADASSGADKFRVGLSAKDPTAPNAGAQDGRGDYVNWMFTIAVESDQHVEGTAFRAGFDDTDEGKPAASRVLELTNETFNCYYIPEGTVLGSTRDAAVNENNSATPILLKKAEFTRNDFVAAQDMAEQVGAWIFSPRAEVSVILARPDLIPSVAGNAKKDVIDQDLTLSYPLFAIGTMISTVEDGGIPYTVNSTIENIRIIAGGSPSVEIRTQIPVIPAFGGLSSSVIGGAISPSLGGTVAQVVEKQKNQIKKLEQKTRNTVVSPPYSGTAEQKGSARIFGTVYGGNATAITTPDLEDFTTWTFPDKKQFIFFLNKDEDPIRPDDWETFYMPEDFEHGDDLPKTLPPGLGFVRLERGSANGVTLHGATASWDADLDAFGSKDNNAAVAPSLAKAQIKDGKLILYWSEGGLQYVTPIAPDTVATFITLTSDTGGALAVSTFASKTDNKTTFNLSRAVETTEVITIALQVGVATNGIVTDADGLYNLTTVADARVIFSNARNCYVPVVNRAYEKTLTEGTVVDLVDLQYELTDLQAETELTKGLLDVLPRTNALYLPHRHLNESGGVSGGGIAFASFLPGSYSGLQALGLTDLIRKQG